MNVLVVDDEMVQIESLRRGLRSKGMKVVEALSGEEALSKLKTEKEVDMVLTDYAMPGMNGIDLLKKIRESNAGLPVIMMTAYGEKDLIIDALRHRCDSFIQKPFTLDELMTELERAKVNMIQNTNTHRLAELIPKMVHQINNPLMAIVGTAELSIMEWGDSEEVRERMKVIIEATKEISQINREIMDLGNTTGETVESVDMVEMVRGCASLFEDLLALKDVRLEDNLGESPMAVYGNRGKLEQLFKNLMLNAIDAMDGQPDKVLRLSGDFSHDQNRVFLYVEDTGCGIPENVQDKVFEPFVTCKPNGTGLGLAVAMDIVERHRGKLAFSSQENVGTQFTVSLPVNQD